MNSCMLAARHADSKFMDLILTMGPDLTLVDDLGFNCLHYCLMSGSKSKVKKLLAAV
jgi:ankyrin repeat protein